MLKIGSGLSVTEKRRNMESGSIGTTNGVEKGPFGLRVGLDTQVPQPTGNNASELTFKAGDSQWAGANPEFKLQGDYYQLREADHSLKKK
jgi:hypothetical protein